MWNDFVCSVCNDTKCYFDDFFEKKKICCSCYKKHLISKGKREPLSKEYTCECGSTVLRRHKADHLKTQKHINFINNITKEKNYQCECGSITTRGHKERHLRTKKHQDYISSLK